MSLLLIHLPSAKSKQTLQSSSLLGRLLVILLGLRHPFPSSFTTIYTMSFVVPPIMVVIVGCYKIVEANVGH